MELTLMDRAEVKTEVKDTHFSSKAYGNRDSKETNIEGRLQLDILQVMQRDYKMRSYTLNAVSAEYLGQSLPSIVASTPPTNVRVQESKRKTSITPSSLTFRTEPPNPVDDSPSTASRTPTSHSASWTSSCASSTTSRWRESRVFPSTISCRADSRSRSSPNCTARR